MDDGLHIRNRMMKPLAIALHGMVGGGGNLTNVQFKPIQNCHNESPTQ
jgi:hypothetical protein